MEYEWVKSIHLLSATVLFGTGLGSAYYKWSADRSGNLQNINHTNRTVVIADWVFTSPTIILQPISGVWLTYTMGYSLTDSWIVASLIFYAIAGSCWLPVVWLQIKMRNLSQQAIESHSELSATYFRYRRLWFWLGLPAFVSMVAIYFLMISKPVISV